MGFCNIIVAAVCLLLHYKRQQKLHCILYLIGMRNLTKMSEEPPEATFNCIQGHLCILGWALEHTHQDESIHEKRSYWIFSKFYWYFLNSCERFLHCKFKKVICSFFSLFLECSNFFLLCSWPSVTHNKKKFSHSKKRKKNRTKYTARKNPRSSG